MEEERCLTARVELADPAAMVYCSRWNVQYRLFTTIKYQYVTQCVVKRYGGRKSSDSFRRDGGPFINSLLHQTKRTYSNKYLNYQHVTQCGQETYRKTSDSSRRVGGPCSNGLLQQIKCSIQNLSL